MIDAAKEAAAEQTGNVSEISTDYDPRRRAADLGAETAFNTMGAPVLGAGAVPGMTLSSGYRLPKKPPAVAVTHATGSPAEFERLKLPPPEHDIGLHATVDPTISGEYADKGVLPGTMDFMSGKRFDDPDAAGPRLKPFLMDAQSALKYPTDAVKWNKPENVISGLEDAMRGGFTAPRGLLSEMYNIGGTEKGWQKDFIPMLKGQGYDSLWYPHYSSLTGSNPYNTFMAFDPKQLAPRYSPEGQALAKERGVKEQIKVKDLGPEMGLFTEDDNWRLPKGILKPQGEIESLVKSHSLNTYPWWDNPKSPLYKIEKAEEAKRANLKEQKGEALAMHKWTWEQEQLYDKFAKGKMSEKEYFAEHKKLEDKKDQYYGGLLYKSPDPSNLKNLSNKWDKLVDDFHKGKITEEEYIEKSKNFGKK
jgi:hypothetical protein